MYRFSVVGINCICNRSRVCSGTRANECERARSTPKHRMTTFPFCDVSFLFILISFRCSRLHDNEIILLMLFDVTHVFTLYQSTKCRDIKIIDSIIKFCTFFRFAMHQTIRTNLLRIQLLVFVCIGINASTKCGQKVSIVVNVRTQFHFD